MDNEKEFPLLLAPPRVNPPTGNNVAAITGAPGGPLFIPNFVSPRIHVRRFQRSCISTLQSLQYELNDPAIDISDDADLLVDNLKLISEDDLVNNALKKVVEERINEAISSDNDRENQNDITSKKGKENSALPRATKRRKRSSAGQVEQDTQRETAASEDQNGSTSGLLVDCRNTVSNNDRGDAEEKSIKSKTTKSNDCDQGGDFVEKIEEEPLYTKIKMEREAAKANCQLHSLRALQLAAAQSESRRKISALNFFLSPLKIDTTSITEVQQVQDLEVVLWIEVRRRMKRQRAQGYLVLGSQLLTTFRDKIYCLTDELMSKAHCHVPSGYFQIEEVFYNDLRNPAAIDYSAPILEWLQGQPPGDTRGIPKNSYAADMASTTFLDLNCCVGKFYTYCHQGDCKHDFVIRDMRLIHKEDIQNALLYPLLRSQLKVRRRRCTICQIYVAKKVAYDDKLAPQSPCFFCEYCYYLLHYSQEGTLLYDDFRVYDYYHE